MIRSELKKTRFIALPAVILFIIAGCAVPPLGNHGGSPPRPETGRAVQIKDAPVERWSLANGLSILYSLRQVT